MEIKVQNFMGCAEADIKLEPMALVVGGNYQGKSSLCRAVRAAVTGNVLPFGLKKTAAAMLVRTGAAKATVEIAGEDGRAQVEWPRADHESKGAPPTASACAVGLENLPDLPPREQAPWLMELIGGAPSRDDLAAALSDIDLPSSLVEDLWSRIEVDGWEKAHIRSRDRGREIKAQWNLVTSQDWGVKKGAAWTPADWSDELTAMSESDLIAANSAAQAEYDDAIGNQAVTDSDRERWAAEAAKIDHLKPALAEAKAASDDAQKALEKAQMELAGLPVVQGANGTPCPWCAQRVQVTKNKYGQPELAKFEQKQTKEEIDDAMKKRKVGEDAVATVRADWSEKRGAEIEIESGIKAALAAAKNLQEAQEKQGVDAATVSQRKNALDRSAARLAAWRSKTQADRLHDKIVLNGKIVDVLAPTGLRQQWLSDRLEGLNTSLSELTKVAGWEEVKINTDASVELAGRPFLLLSESEQYRARVALQVVAAQYDGSKILIIDGADILDPRGRAGLFKALAHAEIPALVAMTTKPDKVPDLSAMGAGQVYHIEKGVIKNDGKPS